jgi:hypothetical protein
MTLVRARVSGRSTWGHCASGGPHWRPRLGELVAAGDIDAGQVCAAAQAICALRSPGIDTVLAEAAQTSPVAASGLAPDEDTTLIDHGRAASADIQGKVIAELMDVVVHPALRRERGASGPT